MLLAFFVPEMRSANPAGFLLLEFTLHDWHKLLADLGQDWRITILIDLMWCG
jgi:hypothetical protein